MVGRSWTYSLLALPLFCPICVDGKISSARKPCQLNCLSSCQNLLTMNLFKMIIKISLVCLIGSIRFLRETIVTPIHKFSLFPCCQRTSCVGESTDVTKIGRIIAAWTAIVSSVFNRLISGIGYVFARQWLNPVPPTTSSCSVPNLDICKAMLCLYIIKIKAILQKAL